MSSVFCLMSVLDVVLFLCFILTRVGNGTPKTINVPFVPNGTLMDFRCPNSQTHLSTYIFY